MFTLWAFISYRGSDFNQNNWQLIFKFLLQDVSLENLHRVSVELLRLEARPIIKLWQRLALYLSFDWLRLVTRSWFWKQCFHKRFVSSWFVHLFSSVTVWEAYCLSSSIVKASFSPFTQSNLQLELSDLSANFFEKLSFQVIKMQTLWGYKAKKRKKDLASSVWIHSQSHAKRLWFSADWQCPLTRPQWAKQKLWVSFAKQILPWRECKSD